MGSDCPECRAISRQLAKIFGIVSEALDPAVLRSRLSEWQTWIVDGEFKGEQLPTIAPEILDAKLHKPNNPFAEVFKHKLTHEQRTGHKIKFPPEL